MYLEEISQVIDRLRQWRAQTKQILDGINKRYPPEKTRELLSLKEYGELCNLIGFTAQEYVQLIEKYEKLIFGFGRSSVQLLLYSFCRQRNQAFSSSS